VAEASFNPTHNEAKNASGIRYVFMLNNMAQSLRDKKRVPSGLNGKQLPACAKKKIFHNLIFFHKYPRLPRPTPVINQGADIPAPFAFSGLQGQLDRRRLHRNGHAVRGGEHLKSG
jgi:hypothetical protein